MVQPSSQELLARLRALPAGERLLAALDDGPLVGVHLVGGAVRDLVLEREPGELDLVVDGDAAQVASELARRLEGAGRAHERFGTHTVEADGLRIDVAMARAEDYPRPGGLPEVRAAGMDEDLRRRDFTVNAIALGVSADHRGELAVAPGALADLEARRLRVLHDASFRDDPTRLLRLVRYATRLGFAIEERTERLAREALAAGAPDTAGVARMGSELMLLLAEDGPVAVDALVALRDLAGPGGLDPDLDVDPELLHRALGLWGGQPGADRLLLAAITRRLDPAERLALLEGMHVGSPGPVLDAAKDPEGLARAMTEALAPSDLHRLLRRRVPEAAALAGAVGAEEPARRWLEDLRHRRLEITGEDLLRAGVPQGREIGERLDAALSKKLDHGLATREDELAAALAD